MRTTVVRGYQYLPWATCLQAWVLPLLHCMYTYDSWQPGNLATWQAYLITGLSAPLYIVCRQRRKRQKGKQRKAGVDSNSLI